MSSVTGKQRQVFSWDKLSDEELFEFKISKLNLRIQDSGITHFIKQLYKELKEKGLSFYPPCFLAGEWHCPVGVPAIGIPFFLAHERLKKIEYKMMLEVEGGTKTWFMKLIRHEAAHAYSYAYFLYKRKKWQKLFGLASQDYPKSYRPRPYSRSYVLHLDNWYAQSHPDEDFAETFAVWLTPGFNWRKRYAGWKALQKIEYVDSLMKELAGKPPLHQPKLNVAEHSGLRLKLKTYYTRKRKEYEEDYPDFYDNDLRRIFTAAKGDPGSVKAAQYLRANRRLVLDAVAVWTKEKHYAIDRFMRDLIDRSNELGLYANSDDPALNLNLASFVTCATVNYMFTGRVRR